MPRFSYHTPMSSIPVVTRFAPSPTGALHLGNVRTALFSFLLARRLGGRFILRIEDTDLERSTEVSLAGLIEDLRWLGLAWDAGPEDVPADADPQRQYRQSRRGPIYDRYFAQLEAAGLAYPCFCSPLELEISRKAQLAAGHPPRYAGTCRELTDEQRRAKRAQGLRPTLRFRVPQGGRVEFEDFVRGPQTFQTDAIGDFIVRRADGGAAFFFCNAVDDALMGVTHVLRGEDHLTNTPRQILLLEALGLAAPAYGHVSLLTGADGAPLSKRHGSTSVADLRARGFLPEAIANHLFRLGHTPDRDEWVSLAEMPQHFHPEKLGRAPARFDEAQLMHWQKETLARADVDELLAWLGPLIPASAGAERARAFVELVRANVMLPEDARAWVDVVFGDLGEPDEEERKVLAAAGPQFFSQAVAAVDRHGGDLKALVAALRATTGRSGAELFMPLRLALTGRMHGPELAPLLKLIPPAKLHRRLEAWTH